MGIRQKFAPSGPDIIYTVPKFGSGDAQEAWRDQCRKDKKGQTVETCVTRGCMVEDVNGVNHKEFQPVSAAQVGGGANLDRLVRAEAVSRVTEREARTNAGEFEFKTLTAISDGATQRLLDKGEGFNASELTVAATEPVQRIDDRGRVVTMEGTPEQPGEERAEDWIKRGIAERVKLRAKVVAKAKRALKRGATEKGA